jgi:hypothetical protein
MRCDVTTNPAVRVGRPCSQLRQVARPASATRPQRATTRYDGRDRRHAILCILQRLAVAVWQAIYKGTPGTER